MPGRLELEFAPFATPPRGVLVLFCEEGLKFGSVARRVLAPTGDLLKRAAAAERFKGKNGSALDLVAPPTFTFQPVTPDSKSGFANKLGWKPAMPAPGRP